MRSRFITGFSGIIDRYRHVRPNNAIYRLDHGTVPSRDIHLDAIVATHGNLAQNRLGPGRQGIGRLELLVLAPGRR